LRPHLVGTWIALGIVCVAAPILGLVVANLAHNPAGNGPGSLQVALGVVVPASISFFTAVVAKRTVAVAAIWAVGSVLATGALLLVVVLFVQFVIQPE
jgi:hypothetical protein